MGILGKGKEEEEEEEEGEGAGLGMGDVLGGVVTFDVTVGGASGERERNSLGLDNIQRRTESRQRVMSHFIKSKYSCIITTLICFCLVPYSAYISQVFNLVNFANLESFMKFIQLKLEPLCCHMHGQHTSMNIFQRIPSKQLFVKILTHEI